MTEKPSTDDTTSARRRIELKPVERRTFLRYGLIGGVGAGLATFGVGSLGFLWPTLSGEFGSDLVVGQAGEILSEIQGEEAPFVFPSGRAYIIAWDSSVEGAMDAYGEEHVSDFDGTTGLMALNHTCVHLGCRVPWCQTSQWFECPCHGSKYNKWGEWVGGPAPRGLDRFPSTVDGSGNLVIQTGTTLTGPSRTARVLQQDAEGPNCVDI